MKLLGGLIFFSLVWGSVSFALPPVSDGLLYVKSRHSVADTVTRAREMMQYHQLRVFGVINHADEAEKIGGKLLPTQLLIFGSPQIGTQMMQTNRLSGIDLPMKLLVWEDDKGVVWISYNQAEYLVRRHQGISQETGKKMADLLRDIAESVAR